MGFDAFGAADVDADRTSRLTQIDDLVTEQDLDVRQLPNSLEQETATS